MICSTCRTAADLASSERVAAYIGSGDLEADMAAEVAYLRELHGQCRGCDCQHRVPAMESTR